MFRRAPLALAAASVALAVAACSSTPGQSAEVAVATTVTSSAGELDSSGGSSNGSTEAVPELFDDAVVHTIDVSFDQAAYDEMIDTYIDSDEKAWIEATVTIDGVTYERAGLRLKGNSSLRGLAANGGSGGPGGDGGRAGQPGGFGPGGSSSAEEPASLPWLIRLDEFVQRQDHQGYEDIVIRSNTSATSLNEAVALDLLAEAGLASQQAVATAFAVNGGEPVLRLAIEHPDDDAWQEAAFEGQGALYKAESTGDWSYRGDDPEAYVEVWDQEGGKDVADLAPLTELLQFLNESDDATLAAELPERLDVDAFATYLAMMELVANFDDIDGPGNNAYLWYDAATGQFTVVPWDMNLAFRQGGFGGGPGGTPPTGFPARGPRPEGEEPPIGEPPTGARPPGAPAEGAGEAGGAGAGGRFGRNNVLVERFHANADFEALYQEKLIELRDELYGSGAAEEILARWADTLTTEAGSLVDADTVAEEASAIGAQLTAE
jgi:spore coat protein CotH